MNMIQTEVQVRQQNVCNLKTGTYKNAPSSRRPKITSCGNDNIGTWYGWQIQALWHTFSCWHPYLLAKTSHFDVDERESICITAPIKKTGFTSVCKKVKRWIKRELWYNIARFGVEIVSSSYTYDNLPKQTARCLFLGSWGWDRLPSLKPMVQFRSRLLIRIRVRVWITEIKGTFSPAAGGTSWTVTRIKTDIWLVDAC